MPGKILFVDDEPDILEVVVFRLKKLGYEIFTASDGQEGLNLIQRIIPDLAILDVRLPTISGLYICKKMKSDEKLKHIPVVLFTASVIGLEDKIKESGADDYLAKPFEPEQLLGKIRKFIE